MTDVAKPDDYYDRYSRQHYVLGEKAMSRMNKANVFVSGLGGVGVEIAKNVALAGVRKLTLHDTKTCTWLDLSTQYYLSEKTIGENRAKVSAARVSELNPYVKIEFSDVDLNGDISFLKEYSCVVLTDAPLALQIKVDDFCHANDIRFMSVDVYGVFGWAFTDFGKNFEIFDKNGEETKEVFLSDITREAEATVTTLEHHMHGLEVGDAIKLTEVEGMIDLNYTERNPVVFKVTKVVSPYKFTINIDTTNMPAYISGGVASEVKMPITIDYLPLSQSLEKPLFTPADFAKFTQPNQLHIANQALHMFTQAKGHLPEPWNKTDADEIVKLANQINDSTPANVEKVDDDLMRKLSFTARGSIIPLTAFMGGFFAQEVIKALSGKYTPLNQWFYLDAVEVLPAAEVDTASFLPKGNRYDAQNICLGGQLSNKLANSKLFMIGAGAIGCEMLKNYALLGVSAGEQGKITVTDNDLIEKSNLNRQFLFRDGDIRSPKSSTAAKAALAMNPALHIEANLDKVGTDTEAKYSDSFFQTLDIVVNALDNVQARLYVDQRCVTNQKPLLESGTMGTKGHVQVILPYLTETYASQRDPPEKDVPFCTIKSFPAQIEHTIQWARDKFKALFIDKPQEVQKFFDDKDNYLQNLRGSNGPKIGSLRHLISVIKNRPKHFDDCIAFARIKFESYFKNAMLQLLHAFPLDMTMKDGSKFWTLPKRPPTPLDFDPSNKSHFDFVYNTALLYAAVFKVPAYDDVERVKKVAVEAQVPVFKAKLKKIETDEKAQKPKEEAVDENEFERLAKEIEQIGHAVNKIELDITEFEKDDDTNHHVDFITAAANLRASCYKIKEGDRLEVKRIAGKIIPAIATTTAAVAGLVSLELIKVIMNLKLDLFKNAFINLALPFVCLSEPAPCEKIPITGTAYYTIWDRWEISQGDITLQEFCDYFEKKHNLKVNGVFQDVSMIYVALMPMHKKRLPQKMTKLLKGGEQLEYVDLIVAYSKEDGTDVNGPSVRLILKSK
jgi:ubiquitin-activating enzyme E1-like protein 2